MVLLGSACLVTEYYLFIFYINHQWTFCRSTCTISHFRTNLQKYISHTPKSSQYIYTSCLNSSDFLFIVSKNITSWYFITVAITDRVIPTLQLCMFHRNLLVKSIIIMIVTSKGNPINILVTSMHFGQRDSIKIFLTLYISPITVVQLPVDWP